MSRYIHKENTNTEGATQNLSVYEFTNVSYCFTKA